MDYVLRQTGLGGTDVAAIIGWSPWADALTVYEAKLGTLQQQEESERMRWGKLLEPAIANEWGERTGWKVQRNEKQLRSLEHPFMMGTPDGFLMGRGERTTRAKYAKSGKPFSLPEDTRGFDCKNSGYLNPDDYGPEGTNEIPLNYLCQLAWYAMLVRVDQWDLVVLEKGNRLRSWHYERDAALEEALLTRAEEFWHKHVLAQQPPTNVSRMEFRRRDTPLTDVILEPTDSLVGMVEKWQDLEAAKKAITEEADGAKAKLLDAMGDAREIRGLVKQVYVSGRRSTGWQAVATAASQYMPGDKYTELVSDHTKTGEPYRRLQPITSKE